MAVSTQTLRLEFPEAIVRASPLKCDYTFMVPVRFLARGPYSKGYVDLKVHPAIKEAVRALAAVMFANGYYFEETSGGTLSCRAITGGSNTSLHAHGVAMDFNPSKNGYRTVVGALDDPDTDHQEGLLQWGKYTDMSPEMIRSIKAIKTLVGTRAWAWGGDFWNIKDAMHFQPAAHRVDYEVGIDYETIEGWPAYLEWAGIEEEYEMQEGFLPIQYGDGIGDREFKKSDVAAVVAMIERAFDIDLDNDGQYDDQVVAAVAKYLGGNGKSVYGNLFDDLMWALAVKAAKSIQPGTGTPQVEVETVQVVKGIKFL